MGSSSSKRRVNTHPILSSEEVEDRLPPSERLRLEHVFEMATGKPRDEGKLSLKQFSEHLADEFSSIGLPLSQIFHAVDVDGSGEIDLEEFLSAMTVLGKYGSPEEKMHLLFQIFDIDGNGELERSEIRKILKMQVMEFSSGAENETEINRLLENHSHLLDNLIDKTVDEIFEEVDENGDERIVLDEWLAGMECAPLLKLWAASIEGHAAETLLEMGLDNLIKDRAGKNVVHCENQ